MQIYIAEDEPLASAKLVLFLQKLGETNIVTFENGQSLLDELCNNRPDIVFLDIHMPGLTGIEVLSAIQNKGAIGMQIIITSAYEQYALESFSFNVTDYLLKPYTIGRLSQALEKARNTLRLLSLDKQQHSDTISFRCDGRNVVILANEIICIESLKDYVCIVTNDGQKRLTLGTMSSFEEKLPNWFMRIHRSFIVNTNHIIEFNNQSVLMSNNQEIAIGKTYREQIESLIK